MVTDIPSPEPGRADLPVSRAARQRRPTGFVVSMRDFTIVEAPAQNRLKAGHPTAPTFRKKPFDARLFLYIILS
jgi:hypothetical protein